MCVISRGIVAIARTMPLSFRGVAHPRPGVAEADCANLSAAEIGTTKLEGTPLLFEHDSGAQIGHCLASWEGMRGELRVAGVVTNETVAHSIRSGKTTGLSLGTDCLSDGSGTVLVKQQAELSVCAEPRRPGCYIDTVDSKKVRHRSNFSKGAGARPSVPLLALSCAPPEDNTLSQSERPSSRLRWRPKWELRPPLATQASPPSTSTA